LGISLENEGIRKVNELHQIDLAREKQKMAEKRSTLATDYEKAMFATRMADMTAVGREKQEDRNRLMYIHNVQVAEDAGRRQMKVK
jgi:hypothetical protein